MILRVIPWLVMGCALCRAGTGEAVHPFETGSSARLTSPLSSTLDNLAAAPLRAAGLRRADTCSDEVFLRRVFLDVIGTLPTRGEAEKFLADKSSGKRAALINHLLGRPEFADYWGMKWGDILRVKAEFPVNLWPHAAQAYDGWIRASLRAKMPCSEFARQLLTAHGSNFRNPPVNFLRAAGGRDPASLADATARIFLGGRFAGWPQEKQDDLAAVFSRVGFKKTREWKEEIVFFDRSGNPGEITLRLPDGSGVRVGPGDDPREAFAHWLVTSPGSPFAAVTANRLWFWIFGRGLVHEPDDFRADNPPSNPRLLEWLAGQLRACGYDCRHLLRIILNSATYQLSPIPADGQTTQAGEAASYPIRRLEAEVLIDAINQITGATEDYVSMIPEPFTFLPETIRAVNIPDGSITSAFLEQFGRPARDTGLLAERPTRVTTSQRLTLLNSRLVLDKINKSKKLSSLLETCKSPHEAATALYLTILSRHPTAEELGIIDAYSPPGNPPPNKKMLEIAWALINTPEFLFRH